MRQMRDISSWPTMFPTWGGKRKRRRLFPPISKDKRHTDLSNKSSETRRYNRLTEKSSDQISSKIQILPLSIYTSPLQSSFFQNNGYNFRFREFLTLFLAVSFLCWIRAFGFSRVIWSREFSGIVLIFQLLSLSFSFISYVYRVYFNLKSFVGCGLGKFGQHLLLKCSTTVSYAHSPPLRAASFNSSRFRMYFWKYFNVSEIFVSFDGKYWFVIWNCWTVDHIGGFCALCALRDQVELSLASSGGTLSPDKLVENLNRILLSVCFAFY